MISAVILTFSPSSAVSKFFVKHLVWPILALMAMLLSPNPFVDHFIAYEAVVFTLTQYTDYFWA